MKDEIEKHLAEFSEDTKPIFKLSILDRHGFYSDLMKDSYVVRVVALPGGHSHQEASKRLSRNPGLVASFSRALSEGLNANQTQDGFDRMLVRSVEEICETSMT